MGLSSKLASSDDVATLDWSQEILETGGLLIPKPTNQARNRHGEQQQQRQHWPPLKCPRCESTNTKFCYYNNYSRTQPRHFCKACKRHWTEGGTLRNVPVGGGRKNKRTKPTTSASTSTAAAAASATSTATAFGAAAAKANSTSSAPLPPPLPSKFPLLFNGDNSSNVFPEILRRILLRPPLPPAPPPQPLPQLQLATADYTFASSFPVDPSLQPPFSSREGDDNGSSNPPFSMISSSYAYALQSATEDAVNACSAAAGGWQVGQATALPRTTGGIDHSAADCWSGWDDDMGGGA